MQPSPGGAFEDQAPGAMSLFGVRGGPHEGVPPVAAAKIFTIAEQAGAREIKHDPSENVSDFVINAPTTPHAFGVVREIFSPLYGDSWWAEVSSFPHFN